MSNLQDIIHIAKNQGGKFFVMDDTGEVKLVILPLSEYQHLVGLQKNFPKPDPEKVNQEIVKAQISVQSPSPQRRPDFRAVPAARPEISDLREEVIDPSFDFEGPKPDFGDF